MAWKPIQLPATSAETKAAIKQLHTLRKNRAKRDAGRERQRDDARKARIGGRLVHLVRQDDDAAIHHVEQILKNLQEGDRPLFKGWSAKPAAEPVVKISDRHRPRTLAEIDAEIERMKRHLEQQLPAEAEEDKLHHTHRMIVVGGGLLALVRGGSREADELLGRIVAQIPAKEQKPFQNWNRPTAAPKTAAYDDKRRTEAEIGPGEPTDQGGQPGAAAPETRGRVQDRKRPAAGKAAGDAANPTPKTAAPDDDEGRAKAEPGPDESADHGDVQPDSTAPPSASGGAASTPDAGGGKARG